MIRIVCLYGLFAISGAFMFDRGPCDLEPLNVHSNTEIPVPKTCANGTFLWNYPRGHVVLLFEDYGRTTAVCLYDDDGYSFNIYDITPGHHMAHMQVLERQSDRRMCTAPATGQPVKIRVDATERNAYQGTFKFYLELMTPT
ncbi:uncharacterized protein LOC127838083 isoform X1 [Dreissena polymorpha]|uniref:Secreted protein n=1 Tax=Dreissena polymorpha TaxID=45954 RepID=A0A9D4FCT8_DREPO|nr:uncharacterized protein LOC127838083 isoform X1 [Dreissena polymorpha]KAH3795073.1 hypothetical protein DPMN_148619 [Dreissena polymorpha]